MPERKSAVALRPVPFAPEPWSHTVIVSILKP